MTEQEKIEKACKAHQFRSKKETFQAGVTFALSSPDLMRGVLEGFGQWLWKNYTQVDAQVWEGRWVQTGTVYTINELIDIFLTDKQKQDAAR